MVETVSRPSIEGETVRFSTSDRRAFFGRFVDGALLLNTKRDFKGRSARIDGNELAGMLFDKAKHQGQIDKLFGDAREVCPTPEQSPVPLRRFGVKSMSGR